MTVTLTHSVVAIVASYKVLLTRRPSAIVIMETRISFKPEMWRHLHTKLCRNRGVLVTIEAPCGVGH